MSTETQAPLPEPVRARVLALAADGLGRMAAEHLPASLKRVASFTPARRAKLAGAQIAAVLDTDETFREHLATQVRALAGELGQALLAGQPPAAADPVEVAATAYLLRTPGWEEVVAAAGEAAQSEHRAGTPQDHEHAERLQRRLHEAHENLERTRTRAKEQVDRLKVENADLRRKLGETRQRAREAESGAESARTEAEGVVTTALQAQAMAEAEVRRLRARVAELEADVAAARRVERSAKVGESTRARLLVDAVVDAAQGLRRELGLPPVDRLPADSVEAHLAEDGNRISSGRGSLPVDDPQLLEELLRLPRAHLVVDGYNVTKTALPDLSLERQRERLVAGVAPLVARTGAEVTVVFDAAETRNRPPVTAPRGVRVLFSPYGVIADDVIRDLVAAEPAGRAVVVASSDQAVARDVASAGFRVVAAAALAQLVLRSR